jgi:hypothetical protein
MRYTADFYHINILAVEIVFSNKAVAYNHGLQENSGSCLIISLVDKP